MTYADYLAFEAASDTKHELFVEARRGDRAELTSCGEPIALDVDAIYRDPLAG